MYLSAATIGDGTKTHVGDHEGAYTFVLCKGSKSVLTSPQGFFRSVKDIQENKGEITCKNCLKILQGDRFKIESQNWHVE